jgi:hypothetical protein
MPHNIGAVRDNANSSLGAVACQRVLQRLVKVGGGA